MKRFTFQVSAGLALAIAGAPISPLSAEGGPTGPTVVAQATTPAQAPSGSQDWRRQPIFSNLSGTILHWNSSGGAWEDSWRTNLIDGFRALTGANVELVYYCCGLDRLQAQVQSKSIEWTIAQVGSEGMLLQGIEAGLFEKLDPSKLPLERRGPGKQYDYAVPVDPYAAVLVWNTKVFGPGKEPQDAVDVFDTKRFPGKRCMMRSVQQGGTLEIALLADGVPASQLYPLDVERALRKLDTIKNDIVWWRSGAESVQFILDRQCDLGIAYNGRAYQRITQENAPLGFTWKNAVFDRAFLAIVKGSPKQDVGTAYLAFLLNSPEGHAKHGVSMGYASPYDGVHEKISPDVAKWLAVGPNLEHGVWSNAEYYRVHLSDVSKRFAEWLVKQ